MVGQFSTPIDNETTSALEEVVLQLKKRLDWAMGQIRRLDAKRDRRGSLEAEDDALFRRCDRLIKRYKGELRRHRRESEGVDDTATFGVLAAEGFLPGYGLETGAILGTANVPRTAIGLSDFDLGRPPAMAIREYVPGNMIYTNGHRFVPRYFHLDRQTETGAPLLFQVDREKEAIIEVAAGPHVASMGSTVIRAVPMSDVDLAHVSHISDDEDYRF